MTYLTRKAGRPKEEMEIIVFVKDPPREQGYKVRRRVEFMEVDGAWHPHVRHMGKWHRVYTSSFPKGMRYILTGKEGG